MQNSIIIYILCSDDQKLNHANDIYAKYSWAKPIVLKYQNYSFENTFWEQLNEIYNEWENCTMVGSLSYSAFKKIKLDEINEIIINKLYYPNKYYHFMDSNISIPNNNTNKHPNFMIIWNDILQKLCLKTTTENCCNYWMCCPLLMKHFISWYRTVCYPELIKHPLIFSNASYISDINIMKKEKLIKLWGNPYYPHFPFIVERLNKCFFETYYPEHVEKQNNFCWEFYTKNHNDLKNFNKIQAKDHYYKFGQFEKRICSPDQNIKNELCRYNNLLPKMIFLISHDKNKGGAQNCLFNVEKLYQNHEIKTQMLYLEDIINIDIINYILLTASTNNHCPIVFCNTLCCYNIVYKLSNTNILTYWYIHEWYDNFTSQIFAQFIYNNDIFNSAINLIFVCNASYNNYINNIPIIKNYHIIYNTFSIEKLNFCLDEVQNNIVKQSNDIYLSIIGTVEKRKNQQEFIDNIFYKLKDKYSQIKLVIVGRIDENLNIDHNYINDIINIGVVDNALPYINLSDIIVSYSINEVLPLNIIESFYCSKPVVSSNIGGINEIINDNYNGYLFEINDHNKCFDILCNLIENKDLRDNIGIKAKETFFEKFDEKIVISKFLSLLEYK
jgi:glycosyltransferase involved in cell wall biosynthesis